MLLVESTPIIGGSKGMLGKYPLPPPRYNFFHFHAVIGKNVSK